MIWEFLKLTLITVIIGLLVVFIIVLIRLQQPLDLPKRTIILSSAIEQMKNGDLVAVSYSSTRGKLVKVFTGSMWTHIGMIYRPNPNEIYVIESASYDDKSGVIKTPWEEWFDWNYRKILAWVPCRSQIGCDQIDKIYSKVAGSEVNLWVVDWLKTMIKQPRNRKTSEGKDRYYCSELIAYLLQELDLLDKKHEPSGYPPKELIFSLKSYDAPYLIAGSLGPKGALASPATLPPRY